jgi:hypothetical protein
MPLRGGLAPRSGAVQGDGAVAFPDALRALKRAVLTSPRSRRSSQCRRQSRVQLRKRLPGNWLAPVILLASPMSSYIKETTIFVDGDDFAA